MKISIKGNGGKTIVKVTGKNSLGLDYYSFEEEGYEPKSGEVCETVFVTNEMIEELRRDALKAVERWPETKVMYNNQLIEAIKRI